MKLSVLLFGSIQGYPVRRNRRFLHGCAGWSIIIQHSLISVAERSFPFLNLVEMFC
jgi:hypothetical protein